LPGDGAEIFAGKSADSNEQDTNDDIAGNHGELDPMGCPSTEKPGYYDDFNG
jgi:hypothetical protein